jgi:metal iron transporter
MPHSLFLGSALATQDRLSPIPPKDDILSGSGLGHPPEERRAANILGRAKSSLRGALQTGALDNHRNRPQRYEDRENNSYRFVESHVHHAAVDIVLSLLGIAVVINSM